MSCAPDGAPAGQTTAGSSLSPHKTHLLRVWCPNWLHSLQVINGLGVKGVHAVVCCCVVRSLQCRARVRPQQGGECADPQQTTKCCKAPSQECLLLTNTSTGNDQVVLSIRHLRFYLKGVCVKHFKRR